MTASTCTTCTRPMRPIRARLADHPGTVRESGRGRCDMCAKKSSSGGRVSTRSTIDVGAFGYQPIPEPTAEERRLILRQVNRLGGDDAGMFAAMFLGPVMS